MFKRILVSLSAILLFSCDSSTSATEDSSSSSSLQAPSSSSALNALSSAIANSSGQTVPSSSSGEASSSSSIAVAPSSSDAQTPSSSEAPSSSAASPYGTIAYGNQIYKTIVIASQTWMAENLNYTPPTGNSWCYNGIPENCATYGRLYDWSTAMGVDVAYNNYNFTDTVKQRGICPTGWHIPRNSEWKTLVDNAGGSAIAAANLRATSVWRTVDSIVNTDQLHFSALPAGDFVSPGFFDIDNRTYWWTATGDGAASAFYRGMVYEKSKIYNTSMYKNTGYSVRCLRD